MNCATKPYNVFALLVVFLFVSACKPNGQKRSGNDEPASIAAVETEYYTHGDFVKTFELASSAAKSYHQKNAVKQEAEALLWMADTKLVQGDYVSSEGYLNQSQPLIGKLEDDSLTIEGCLLRGKLFTARILTDSAQRCFQQAEKHLNTNSQNSLLKTKLCLLRIALNEQLHQAPKVDSLTRQVLKDPHIKTGHKGYYYALALASRIQFINWNGSPDSALLLSGKLAGEVNQSFPQNNYLQALLYQSLSRSGLNNMDYEASLKYAKKELVYAHASGNPTTLFYAYYDMQQACVNNQDFMKALSFTDSIHLVRENSFPEKSIQASIVNNTYGRILTNTHDYNRARHYLLKSIRLDSAIFGKNSGELASAYSNMGNLYSYQGVFDSVLYYNQKVLSIRKMIYPKDHLQIAFCMDDIARTYNNMDKPVNALPYQQEIEKIYKKNYGPTHSYIAWAYDAEADSYGQLRQYDKAVLYSDKALELFIPDMRKDTNAINHTSAIPFDIYVPDYLTSRIQIFCNRGINAVEKNKKISYLQEAYRISMAANKYIQSYTSHFDSPESVAIFYQRMYEYYKLCADVSYRLYQLTGEEKYRSSILNYSENKRGAFLRSNVFSKSIKFSGVPASVIKEEADIRNAVTAASGKTVAPYKKDSVNKVYEQFLHQLSAKYANYYRLKYLPFELNEKDIQAWLPNDSTVFAEYMISKERVYILLVSKKSCSVIGLDKKDSVIAKINGLSQLLRKFDTKAYYARAYEVYKYLVQPMEQYVKPGSKIIVSADGALSTLSFEALVTRSKPAGKGFDAGDFLLNKYNFSYAVSAFSLLNPFDKGGIIKEKDRAYFSAPGFDDQLKSDYKQYAVSHQLSVDNDYMSYLYQPFMMKLGDVLSGSWKVTKSEGGEATESAFKEKAPGNNIVQIGSHALLNDIDPMKSCLVFAKELSTAKGANDGYLYSSEIYNQRINADLVILTACETGGGEYKEGEGMMSLSYSFQYAGCKGAIMSLWPVDEKTASTITEYFYKNLAEGKTTSEALYQAKKDFLKTADGGLVNPFYWSGLVLMGPDENIKLQKKDSIYQYAWFFGALGVVVVGAVGIKKWKSRQAA
ncbi:MAG TPA: CHAT domain-containing tetratricopeptide repeat protein [Mucilaginibacter sp.]|nr:CHAT domain-containing tetratricopeptide repeat protein [Mucilaginibacter sp.]